MGEAALVARLAVGTAFLLTAAWKLRNPQEFQAVLRERTSRFRRARWRGIPIAVAGIELGIALLLFLPSVPSPIAAIAASALLGGFTALLLIGESSKVGCGCWRSEPEVGDGAYVGRNVVLLIMAATAGWATASVGGAMYALSLVLGAIVAITVLEAPGLLMQGWNATSGGGKERR